MENLEKEKLLEEIIEKFGIYKGQEITLSFFYEMYETLKTELTEGEFINLLGIKKKTYSDFKVRSKENKDAKIKVLMSYSLDKKERMKKLIELVNKYNLYRNKQIDYSSFKEMYNTVRLKLTEVEFADLLGITGTSLRNIRKEGSAKLFRNAKLNEEAVEAIRQKLVEENEGKRIYYKDNDINNGDINFLKLYQKYRICFSPLEFANLLGISEKSLWYAKNSQANPLIKDIKKQEKAQTLKKEIVEGKYYSKYEIQEICRKYELSIDDFIIYYINKGNFFDTSEYRNAIEHNKRLWIGKIRIENSNLEKYNEMLSNIAGTVVNGINKKYRFYFLEEDIKSDMLLYIIDNCGDIIQNFEYDKKLMERMLWLRARKYAQIKYVNEYKKEIKKVTLVEGKIAAKEELKEEIKITDENIEPGKIDENKLIELFKSYLSQGYDKETIINNISRTFKIEKEEMLEMMKKYLLENGKVVQNEKGEYEIGDK